MATDTEAPVKERSVPEAGVHRCRGGGQGVPVVQEPHLQLLHAGQAAGDDLRGRHRRRPARSRAPSAPGLDLRLRRRPRRLPAGVDRAQVVQLARVPRSQRGVGADDLPQQRQRRAADRAEPGQRQGRASAFEGWNSGWIKIVERHVSAWTHAEHGIGMHVYIPAQRDAPDQHDQQRAVGRPPRTSCASRQDIILYNLELSESIEGFDGAAHKEAWISDPIWQGVRENVERLTAIRDWAEAFFAANGRVRAAGGRAVPLRSS